MTREKCKECDGRGSKLVTEDDGTKHLRHCWPCRGKGFIKVKDDKKKEAK